MELSRHFRHGQRALDFSVLAGNGYVLLKQSTAILHGFFACWAPSGVLKRADGSHEVAHRHVSSFLFLLAASSMDLGEISLKEVAQTPYFTARMRGEGTILAQKKEMDGDTHFNNLTALIRAAGVGGTFSRSPSAVPSGYGALSLSAAAGSNISRTAKELLSASSHHLRRNVRRKN